MSSSLATKRKSDEVVDYETFPHNENENQNAQTPIGSPARKRMRTITRNHKQVLIDNLQLESASDGLTYPTNTLVDLELTYPVSIRSVTERARRLRAQYALQACDLRGRIERRINRVPVGLRKARMGDLLETHNNAVLRAQQPQTMVTSKKPTSPSKTRNATTLSVDVVRNSPNNNGTSPRKTKKQR